MVVVAREEIQAHAPTAQEVLARKDVDTESLTEIARNYNVSHSTISRLSP
jgi:DNA-binding MurR/RpiR family transcriptional regulator